MIGSHNTFTYKRPVRWWMRLLRPVSRCQCRELSRQGGGWCGLYDMRVRVYRGELCVSHGPVVYCTFAEAMRELTEHGRRHGRQARVRLLLEGTCPTGLLMMLERHIKGQEWVEFYCGRHRRDWSKLLDIPDLGVDQRGVASMGGAWWGKLWPRLWWRCHRRRLERWQDAARDSAPDELFDFV